MNIGELCNREVVLAYPDESLIDAARRMREHHVGTLVVVSGEAAAQRRPVGIITDRDIVVQVLAKDPDDLSRLDVGDVMSFKLVTAKESESPDEVMTRMRRNGVRRVPVIDAEGALIGILALDDLLEFMAERLEELAKLVSRERHLEEELRA